MFILGGICNMKRAALYVRVSTAEQRDHGVSVDSQIAALHEYCQKNGYTEVGLYNDAGISAHAKYTKRKALCNLIDDCQSGKVDIILFTKLDRWFRSVKDYYEVMAKLPDNIPWRAIWEDYETETSGGVFKVNIMLSIAQAEAERTSERIKAVNEYRRANGDFVGGLAPIGYRIENNRLLIDKSKEKVISDFFRIYLESYSPTKAIDYVQNKYEETISRRKALRILKSEVYMGNAYGYQCESYISESDHKKIIESIEGRKNRESGTKRTYLFSGLIYCPECGSSMSAHYNRCTVHGTYYYYPTYRCIKHSSRGGCSYKSVIFESTIEKHLINNIKNIIDEYMAKMNQINSSKSDIELQIKKLNEKLSRIGTRFEDGDIDIVEYRTKRDLIKTEISILSESVSDAEDKRLPDNWLDTYNELNQKHKKAFWKNIIKRIDIVESNPRTFKVTI